jgi:hypothetical protein
MLSTLPGGYTRMPLLEAKQDMAVDRYPAHLVTPNARPVRKRRFSADEGLERVLLLAFAEDDGHGD